MHKFIELTVWNSMARENRTWWCNKICFTNENKVLVFRSKTRIKRNYKYHALITCFSMLITNISMRVHEFFVTNAFDVENVQINFVTFNGKMMKLQQEQPRGTCTVYQYTMYIAQCTLMQSRQIVLNTSN